MRAVVFDQPGAEEVLRVGEVSLRQPAADEIAIRVRTTSVNRADLLQRRGLYPPPAGASPILGLECAGEVSEVGSGVERWRVGDRVMALLAGGGYAERALVHEGSVVGVPPALSDEEAGGFMEVFVTAFSNIFMIGEPPAGGVVLVHGGSGGVGTAAIALCREAGLTCIVTAGSARRCARCLELGATRAVDYTAEDFVSAVQEATGRRGVDVVLDCVGAPYLDRNIAALAPGGALVLIGLMGGAKGPVDLSPLLGKRARVVGTTLRSRANGDKARIIAAMMERFGGAIGAGRVKPVIDRVLPLDQAGAAHRAVAGDHFGKVVLTVWPGA